MSSAAASFRPPWLSLSQEHARVVDLDTLKEACQGVLSELATEGLNLLNSGDYYEAHESLEHAWLEASEWEGYLYRTLLQVSVAYLHVEKGNYAGAVKMLLRVRQWLDPLPDQCRGVDMAALRENVEAFSVALDRAGEAGISELDRALLKPIPMLPLRPTKGESVPSVILRGPAT